MKNFLTITADTTGMHSGRQQQLWLGSFIIASIIIHGMILWIGGDTLFNEEQPIDQLVRIVVNLQQDKVQNQKETAKDKVIKQQVIKSTEKKIPATEPRVKTLNAQQLILRSLDFIRLQQQKEMAQPAYRSFEQPATDPLFISPDKQAEDVETFQQANGNTMLKMKSIFGGYQCYEIPESNETDAFSLKATWMFTRCW